MVPIAPRFRPMPPITAPPRTESSRGRATSSAAFLLLGLVALGSAAAHSRAPSLDIDMFPILDIYSYSWIYLLLLNISLTLRSTGTESPRVHSRPWNQNQHINFGKPCLYRRFGDLRSANRSVDNLLITPPESSSILPKKTHLKREPAKNDAPAALALPKMTHPKLRPAKKDALEVGDCQK